MSLLFETCWEPGCSLRGLPRQVSNSKDIRMSLLFETCWEPGCSLRGLPRRQSNKRRASSRDGESVMSSEVRPSGRQPYRQPDQAEADGVIQAIFAEEAGG